MSSKNNVENRGAKTEFRRFNNKVVKPVLYIERGFGRYMAAQYEDGNLAIDPSTKKPLHYKNADIKK